MQYKLCRHILTRGVQCKSPALSGKPHCFFHMRLYDQHSCFRPPAQTPQTATMIQFAPLEDLEAIQIALSQVIHALASGQLEHRRASVLLYGLQMASSNCRNMRSGPLPSDVIRSAQSTPEGLDIAAPGALGEDYR